MAKLAANTYGEALFELALEEQKVDEYFEEIQALERIFLENPQLAKLMNHPKIDKTEKLHVMEDILKGNVSDEIAGFIQIIITKDRYDEWNGIFDYFIDRVKEYKNIGTAYVTTPAELSDSQKERVKARLLETTKYEKIEVIYDTDESLIGGMVIRIRDRVVDSSIKTKLYELTKDLEKIQLAV